MTFFEIEQAAAEIMSRLVDADGVVNEDVLAELQALDVEKESKIESVALWMKEKLINIDALKATKASEAERFDKLIEREQKEYDSLGKFMFDVLAGEKWKAKSGKAQIVFRPKDSTEIDDSKALKAWAEEHERADLLTTRTTVTTTVSKTAVAAAINAGEELPFCHISHNVNASVK